MRSRVLAAAGVAAAAAWWSWPALEFDDFGWECLELACWIGSQRADRGFMSGRCVVALGLILDGAPSAQTADQQTPSSPASEPTSVRLPQLPARAREGNRGTTLSPARPARTPSTGSSEQPLPSPAPPYDPPPRRGER